MGCCVVTPVSPGSIVRCSPVPASCIPRRVSPCSASQIVHKGWRMSSVCRSCCCFGGEVCTIDSMPGKTQRLSIPLTEREIFTIMRSWKNIQGKMVETGIFMFLRLVSLPMYLITPSHVLALCILLKMCCSRV